MKVSRRKAAIATWSASTLNVLILSIQAFVLIPLYLQHIGNRLYGAWLGSGEILVWIAAFDFGLPNLLIQRIGVAHGRGDTRRMAEYFATGTVMILILAVLVGSVGVGLSLKISSWMGLDGAEATLLRSCFLLGVVTSCLNIANNAVVAFCRGVQKTGFISGVLVLAGLVSFALSGYLVITGWGLWAIAWGLMARTAVSTLGSIAFVIITFRGEMMRFLSVKKDLLRDLLSSSPAVFLAAIGAGVPIETTLVAVMVRPEMAVIYNITRKAADMAASLAGMISQASLGGFSHLVGADPKRAMRIHSEIMALFTSFAIAVAAAYIALNSNFISIWVGPQQFGGHILTILMGLGTVMVGRASLINNLYRFSGPMVKGSIMIIIETILKIILMMILLQLVGLPGLPTAALITSLISSAVCYRWTVRNLSQGEERPIHPTKIVSFVHIGILFCAIIACFFIKVHSWIYVLSVGILVPVGAGLLFLTLNPLLSGIRGTLWSIIRRQRFQGAILG